MLVVVRDLGPGLSSAGLDRIFEAFYTTKPSGLGMGLSICRTIIEAHGGRLWAPPPNLRARLFNSRCLHSQIRQREAACLEHLHQAAPPHRSTLDGSSRKNRSSIAHADRRASAPVSACARSESAGSMAEKSSRPSIAHEPLSCGGNEQHAKEAPGLLICTENEEANGALLSGTNIFS